MQLENLNPGKRNSKVTVNGHTYQIGHAGFIIDEDGKPLDVPEEDAEKLTQGRAWQKLSWDPDAPENARRMMPDAKGGGIGRRPRTRDEMKWDAGIRPEPKTAQEMGGQAVTVPTKDGKPTGDELVEKQPTDEEIQKSHEAAEAEIAAANRKALEQDTGLLSDMGEPATGTETTREIETMSADAAKADTEAADAESTASEGAGDPSADGGDEWPDPTEEMKVAYLRQMADAYEVPHTVKTSKKVLIKNIMSKMYPEEG